MKATAEELKAKGYYTFASYADTSRLLRFRPQKFPLLQSKPILRAHGIRENAAGYSDNIPEK